MAFHGNAANANVTTDVSAGTYGSGNAIPVITIDAVSYTHLTLPTKA